MQGCVEAGITCHPKEEIIRLAKKFNATIIDAKGHTIGDCWIVEMDKSIGEQLPSYFTQLKYDGKNWKEI
jgi:hypothetical protein